MEVNPYESPKVRPVQTKAALLRWIVMGSVLLSLSEADRHGFAGFYYFFPRDTDEWRFKNFGCMFLYWPLNVVDVWLGTGRPAAAEPLWGLTERTAIPENQISN